MKPTAFLSIPYILSTLAENLGAAEMKMLLSMHYVTTGGEPADTSTEHPMGQRRVRLGGRECGCKSMSRFSFSM